MVPDFQRSLRQREATQRMECILVTSSVSRIIAPLKQRGIEAGSRNLALQVMLTAH